MNIAQQPRYKRKYRYYKRQTKISLCLFALWRHFHFSSDVRAIRPLIGWHCYMFWIWLQNWYFCNKKERSHSRHFCAEDSLKMTVFITTAVIIYFSFIMFSLFAAVQQIKFEKLTNRRSSNSAKKFSLFRHQQTKIVLATSARSLSLWIFALVFLLTDLPETLWSLNHTLSKILLYNGIYDNGYEVWTVMLPILMLYILYEIHFSFFRWILNLNSKEKSVLPFSIVNRLSIFVIGLYFIVNCILLEDIRKIIFLVTAFSLGRVLFPLFKYNYILWAYPVQPMTDPWLSQETSDIAKRNKITVNRILIVKYPSTDDKGVQCLFGNLLVDSRLLHWQTDFTWELSTVPNLNANYVPTVAQKEVRAMITHALGYWVNYMNLKCTWVSFVSWRAWLQP